jgi:hypothetical protein
MFQKGGRLKSTVVGRLLLLSALFMLNFFTSGLAIAASTAPILRILVIDAKGDAASYVREVKRGKPILKRLGIEGEIHVWQATYAGKDTGMIIVTFEFADKASFARSESAFEKASGDPEYDSWVKSLGKVRLITSDSLFEELDSHADSQQ